MKSKIRIMKTKPEVTDEEIRGFMNFDKLLEAKNEALKHRSHKISTRYWITGVTVAVIVTGVWLLSRNIQEPAILKPTSDTPQPSSKEPDRTETETDTVSIDVRQEGRSNNLSKKSEPRKPEIKKAENPKKLEPSTEPLPEPVYVLAEPVEGYPALYDYFNKELVYPPDALKDSIQGIVTVVFSINKDGNAEKIYIENSLGPLFDGEAIRLIENMPLWKPATYNNKPVTSKMSLPLTFQIQKKRIEHP